MTMDDDDFRERIKRMKSMPMYYVLDANKNSVVASLMEWAEFFEVITNRRVAQDFIGDTHVSTVFLGIDHGFGLSSKPLLFETMVFGGKHDELQWRYAEWDEAVAGHKGAVALVVAAAHPWWRKWWDAVREGLR